MSHNIGNLVLVLSDVRDVLGEHLRPMHFFTPEIPDESYDDFEWYYEKVYGNLFDKSEDDLTHIPELVKLRLKYLNHYMFQQDLKIRKYERYLFWGGYFVGIPIIISWLGCVLVWW